MKTSAKFVEFIIKNAENGSPEHQCVLGQMYYNGTDLPTDYKKAVYWLKKSYGKCYKANSYLAKCYMNGHGVDKNIEKAIDLYYEAIKSNDDIGYYDLAHCYKYGTGVNKDPLYSNYLLLKSAELGYSPAQEETGLAFKKMKK